MVVKADWIEGDVLTAAQQSLHGDGINNHSTAVGIDETQTFNGVLFGGDGSDGALSVSSGTTTLNSNQWNQYTSISITGTGIVTITGGAGANGLLLIKCSGDATISSSGKSVDLDGKGAAGGAGGSSANGNSGTAGGMTGQTAGAGGALNSGGEGGVKPTAGIGMTYPFFIRGNTTWAANNKAAILLDYIGPGSGAGGGRGGSDASNGAFGGGGGSSAVTDGDSDTEGTYNPGANSGVGGNGGIGGGSIYLEIAGNFTFSGTIDTSGVDGAVGSGNVWGRGGGGGAGVALVLVTGTITDTGTTTLDGGTGGDGYTAGRGVGADGADGQIDIETPDISVLF